MRPDRSSQPISPFVLFLFLLFGATAANGQEATGGADFATPFADDSSIFARAVELTDGAEESLVVLHESVDYFVHEDGRVDRTNRLVYRIMDERAIENAWGSVFVDWSPWHENRPEIRARVYLPNGETRDLDEATVTDGSRHEGDDAFYSDGRTARAPLPAITVGVVVERQTTVTTHTPFFAPGRILRYPFGYRAFQTHASYARVSYPATPPILYRLDGPQDDVSVTERNEPDGRRVLIVERRNIGVSQPAEPFGDPDRTPLTQLTFTTATSWRDVADGYAQLVNAAIEAHADAAALADRIFGPLPQANSSEPTIPDPAHLVNRFMRWLTANVRYTSLALGEGAITPRTPQAVVESGFGDCKDMATLLCAVLRQRGVDAHVALIRSGYDLDAPADLPGIGLFNHAIVYVDGERGGWIDPTYSWSRLDLLAPSCQGRRALIAKATDDEHDGRLPAGSALVSTPEPDSARTRVIEEREIYFPVEGGARVVEVTRSRGFIGRDYRSAYATLDGDALHESFVEYARDTYSGELTGVSFTAESESSESVLRLEIDDTSYESTGDAAVVKLDEGVLFGRLPDFLAEGEPEAEREGCLVLDHAYQYEIRCRIHLPPGFVARDLPGREERSFGLARLVRDYRVEADGTVTAIARFDSGPRVHDAANARVLHRDLYDFEQQREQIALNFELVAARHLENGDVAGAIAEYRRLAAEDPDEDFYLRRISRALLAVGLGDAARDAARRAVAMAPESSKTLHNLGYVLMHDRIGRYREPGQEYEASLEALRRAHEANPDDILACAELAVALEYDERGRQYAPGAPLEEAAQIAKKFRDHFDSSGLDINLLHVLLRAGLDEELMEFVGKTDEGSTTTIFEIAAIALTNDVESALRFARTEIPDLGERSEALRSAATLLAIRREYVLTKELVEGALPGTKYPAVMRNWIQALDKLKPIDLTSVPLDSPDGLVFRYMAAAIEADPEAVRAVFSKHAVASLGSETLDEFVRAVGTQFEGDTRADTVVDGLSSAPVHVEGSPETGYRIESRVGKPLRLFAVNDEQGALRLVGIAYFPVTMGGEALRRVRRGDIAGARQWLDWARDEAPSTRTDDPVSPVPFTQLWRKGQEADANDIEIAAASLMHDSEGTDVHIPILEAALRDASDDDPRAVPIANALALALDKQRSAGGSERRLEVAARLRRLAPESVIAQIYYVSELLLLRRLDEAWEFSERTAEDPTLERRLISILGFGGAHLLRGDHEAAADVFHEAIDRGDVSLPILALAAQLSLFTPGPPRMRDVEAAKKLVASSVSNDKKHDSLVVQAAVLAEIDPPSALQHLRDSMRPLGLIHPRSEQWYVVGRLAEQHGEFDAARRAYAESVAMRDDNNDDPLHFANLAQKRLNALDEVAGTGD